MGVETNTTTLLCKLARKYQVSVVYSWAERISKGKGYNIYFGKTNIPNIKNSLKDDCLEMNKVIESIVKKKPEQYQWNYKRFTKE